MILTKIYVENYGKLHQFNLDFNNKLNVVLQNNGWGKSTLASFVKAILFGLPASKKINLDENERAKYKPWQGGKWGGYIEFILNNIPYKIERFFGDTASKDSVMIYNLETNLPLNNSENFIQLKLGVDADTFARSALLEQGLFTNASDEGIKTKLGNLIQNQDVSNLNKVFEKLEQEQVKFRFKKLDKGSIPNQEKRLAEIDKEINTISQQINKTNTLQNNNKTLQNEIDKIKKDINELRQKIESANIQKTQKSLLQHYENIKTELSNLQKEQNEIISFFNGEIPSAESIKKYTIMYNKINEINIIEQNTCQRVDNEKIIQLKKYFEDFLPTKEEINEVEQLNQQLNIIKLQLDKNNGLASPQLNKDKVLLLVGIVLFLIGIPIYFINIVACICILIVGFIVTGIALLMIKKSLMDNKGQEFLTIRKLKDEENELSSIIKNWLLNFNELEQNFTTAISNVEVNLQLYNELVLNNVNTQNTPNNLTENKLKLQKDLDKFFSQYNFEDSNCEDNFIVVGNKLNRLKYLLESIENKEKEITKFEQQNKTIFSSNLSVTDDADLQKLELQIANLESLKDEKLQDIIHNTSEIERLNFMAQSITKLEAEKEGIHTQLLEDKKNYFTITNTIKFLTIAKDKITSKYLAPLTKEFSKYVNKLACKNLENIKIDTELNLSIEQNGEQKQRAFFSQGSKDILELCMRLSLIKILYNAEMPPLILDDPFTNLDDDKTNLALELLNELAKEFQIIYLVCHSSRTKKS